MALNGVQGLILDFGSFSGGELEALARPFVQREAYGMGRSAQRTQAFLAGRLAAGMLLRKYDIDGAVLSIPPHGHLAVEGSSIHLSIGHTDHVAVAAFGPSPLGIDIEPVDRVMRRALRRILHPEELSCRSPFAEQGRVPASVALWCGKEAYTKATGYGTPFRMRQIHIELAGEPPYRVHSAMTGPLSLSEPAVRFHLFREYCIALCTCEQDLLGALSWTFLGADSLESQEPLIRL